MKRYLPVAVFLSVAIMSIAASAYAYLAGQEASRARFEAVADEAVNRMAGRFAVHMSLLNATQALLEANQGAVSRDAFRSFFEALAIDQRYAGLRGLGVLRIARSPEDAAAAELEIARLHGVGNRIHPASDQAIRAPIVLYEPLDRDVLGAIGYDMYSDPERRPTIDRTLNTGEASTTTLLTLGKNIGSAPFPGFLVFQRLDALVPAPGIGAPERTPNGVIYLTYRSNDLFEAALATAPLLPVSVEVRDTAVGRGNVVFESASAPDAAYGEAFAVTRAFAVADATWTAVLRPTAEFSADESKAAPLLIAILGMVLAGALAAASRYQIRAWDAASALRDSAERSLAEKDLMLQEMKHRIKNSISRVLAIARQTAAHAEGLDEFTKAFSARMQAMAASQDMLTRSRWQKADIGDLLRTELQQVFGDSVPEEMVSGPRVLLDEAATQALGLTFHELATNAMKYGDIAGLRIAWSVRRDQAPRMLDLVWEESGNGADAPEKPGFGTRLIDMNITRELGGTIARDFSPAGLRIAISIPLGRK
ncbi:MAG: CHASE domain-containing protein [Rhizobiaceae bacterium]